MCHLITITIYMSIAFTYKLLDRYISPQSVSHTYTNTVNFYKTNVNVSTVIERFTFH